MTDRETLLAYRLKQAEETLADAQAMAESKLSPRSIVNRTYYAMFYAVLGLFLKAHRVAPVQGAGSGNKSQRRGTNVGSSSQIVKSGGSALAIFGRNALANTGLTNGTDGSE